MRFKTNWLQSCFNLVQNSQLSVKSEATDGDIQKKKEKKKVSQQYCTRILKKIIKMNETFHCWSGELLI